MDGTNMGSSLTVDISLAVDGWAGSDGLPGYFGYLGPEIEESRVLLVEYRPTGKDIPRA
jgi:hypothetical protein